MGTGTNAECGELVAQIHDIRPEDLVGWVVLAITSEGQTLVLSNARSAEQVRETMRSAALRIEDPADG